MIVFIIAILTSSSLLTTLLSQVITNNSGCANYKECLFLLIEGSVGEVNYDEMHSYLPA